MSSLDNIKIQAAMKCAKTRQNVVIVKAHSGYRFTLEAYFKGPYEVILKPKKGSVEMYDSNGKKIGGIDAKSRKANTGSEAKAEPKPKPSKKKVEPSEES